MCDQSASQTPFGLRPATVSIKTSAGGHTPKVQAHLSRSPAGDLSGRTARGAIAYLLALVASKGLNTVTQIVLAAFLAAEDFGLIGLAYTVAVFFKVFEQAGIREILVRTQAAFEHWYPAATWLSVIAALAGAAGMCLAAPWAAAVYDEPEVVRLVYVLAIAAPIQALQAVPRARLEIALRMPAIASIEIRCVAFASALTCALAWSGAGAMSFAIPVPISTLAATVALWRKSNLRFPRRVDSSRWPALVRDSVALIAAHMAILVTQQADYMLLGVFHDTSVVGMYFFAFTLSVQTISLVTRAFSRALFPALSQLRGHPERQVEGFLLAMRMLALVGIPFCLVQAAVSAPLVDLLFASRWGRVVVLLQILSVGMALRVVAGPCTELLKAQKRYGAFATISLVNACLFLAATAGAAATGGSIRVAVVVSIYSALIGPAYLWVAIRPAGRGWSDIARVYLTPALLGTVAVGAAWLLGELVPQSLPGRNLVQLVAVGGTAVMLYGIGCRVFAAELTETILTRLRAVRSQRSLPAE